MNKEKLKPCPFCGGEAEIIKAQFLGGDNYACRCVDCVAQSAFCWTEEKAVAEWNRRNYPEKQDSSNLTYAGVERSGK